MRSPILNWRTTAVRVVLAAALIATAACSNKKKKDLPPLPPQSSAPADTGNGGPKLRQRPAARPTRGIGTSNLPGSQSDFVAQSGSDRVLFGYDSYDIDDEARTILGKQSEWLARYPQIKITIEGHTDERGTREYHLALGDRRANAAKNFLAAQGVAASRIATISYGKERPEAEGLRRGRLCQEPPRGDGHRQRRSALGLAPVIPARAGINGRLVNPARPRIQRCGHRVPRLKLHECDTGLDFTAFRWHRRLATDCRNLAICCSG